MGRDVTVGVHHMITSDGRPLEKNTHILFFRLEIKKDYNILPPLGIYIFSSRYITSNVAPCKFKLIGWSKRRVSDGCV